MEIPEQQNKGYIHTREKRSKDFFLILEIVLNESPEKNTIFFGKFIKRKPALFLAGFLICNS